MTTEKEKLRAENYNLKQEASIKKHRISLAVDSMLGVLSMAANYNKAGNAEGVGQCLSIIGCLKRIIDMENRK